MTLLELVEPKFKIFQPTWTFCWYMNFQAHYFSNRHFNTERFWVYVTPESVHIDHAGGHTAHLKAVWPNFLDKLDIEIETLRSRGFVIQSPDEENWAMMVNGKEVWFDN